MADPLRKVQPDWEPQTVPEADRFRYGWRWKRVRLPGGRVELQQIPLTPEDHLNPQYGDEVPQNEQHAALCTLLLAFLKRRFNAESGVLLTLDMIVNWGIEGLSNPSPDLAVIPGAKPDPARKTFEVLAEGFRPCLVIEVVSDDEDPETRRNDYEKKVGIYQRAGVPEYLIFEPPFNWSNRLLIQGHVLGPDGRYQPIEPDSQGRILSRTTGLLFGVDEDGRTPLVIDALTGERLLSPEEVEEAWKEAREQAAREAEAREAAEEQAAQEAQARKAAEARAVTAEERADRAESENARLRDELERLRKSSQD